MRHSFFRQAALKEGCIICCTKCWKDKQFDKGCQSTANLDKRCADAN
jgi:hypothetical protein